MNWQPILRFMPRRRIYKAAIAALLSHALVLGLSVYLISLFTIPSTIDRVLNLSLITSPMDGNINHESVIDETLNNVEQGMTTSEAIEQLQPDVALKELPNTEADDSPPPIVEQVREPTEQIESVQTTSDSIAVEQDMAAQQSEALPDDKIGEIQEDSMLTRNPSTVFALPKLKQELTSISATEAQQQTLNSKLKEIANNLNSLDEMPKELEWEADGQRYSARFYQVPVESDMGLAEIRVQIKTEFDGEEFSTEMNLKQLAFSNFAQFVHRWDTDLQIHDDKLDGRFHSNSRINLEFGRHSGPIFHGKVTTASHRVNMNRYSNRSLKKNVFLGGLETGVRKIAMPKPSMLYFDDEVNLNENTVHFETDTRIIFNADGSYSAEPLAKSGETTHYAIGDEELYIRSAADATLFLQGTINGKVLVYSPRRIVIEGNLIYADQSDSLQNDDFLGLVSARNIVIASPSVTGRGDLEIDASIYAKGRFIVRSYKTRRSGTLIIFGSVSAGSMSATEPRYATNIIFDPRLEHRRPPKFPTTNRYEVQDQEVRWSRLNMQ